MAKTPAILGKYELLEVIGDGAEGRVYKAVCIAADVPNVRLGELVALKRLKHTGHDKESQLFRRQIAILSQLNHPNIVRYKDSFIWREKELEEDIHCLVMELLEGVALKVLLEHNPDGLPWPQARAILAQTLEALEYSAKNGVSHRDLKTSNIFITRDGTPKLVDFGIARQDNAELTMTGSVAGAKGTFDYMAPDFALLAGGARGDEQSDIFSFGVIMHCTLAGCLPFPPLGDKADRGYYLRWLAKQLPVVEFRQPVFKVLSHARSCVGKCIQPDRAARFQTFAEVKTDFAGVGPRKLRHGSDVYEFTGWLGKGGFGEVFRARRTGDGRAVAIKRLFSTGQSSRFIREAKILRQHSHPHLTEYVDFVEVRLDDGGREFYLVLEFLDGIPAACLRDRIKNSDSGLAAAEALKLFAGYLDCLEHLHRQGIIHRDLKPGNLYAPENHPERAKIFDLGIAHDEEGTRTHGQVPGTLDFMPPEFATQSSGRGSPQSDIYSLGVTLYQTLTKKLPFSRLPETESEAWVAFFSRALTPLECSFDHPIFTRHPDLVPVLSRALAANPKDRFDSAAAMRAELVKVLTRLTGMDFGDGFAQVTAATRPPTFSEDELATVDNLHELELEPEVTAVTIPAAPAKIQPEPPPVVVTGESPARSISAKYRVPAKALLLLLLLLLAGWAWGWKTWPENLQQAQIRTQIQALRESVQGTAGREDLPLAFVKLAKLEAFAGSESARDLRELVENKAGEKEVTRRHAETSVARDNLLQQNPDRDQGFGSKLDALEGAWRMAEDARKNRNWKEASDEYDNALKAVKTLETLATERRKARQAQAIAEKTRGEADVAGALRDAPGPWQQAEEKLISAKIALDDARFAGAEQLFQAATVSYGDAKTAALEVQRQANLQQENADYAELSDNKTEAAIGAFLAKHRDGVHAQAAEAELNQMVEERKQREAAEAARLAAAKKAAEDAWQQAGTTNTEEALINFVKAYPGDPHVSEARLKIESLAWQQTARQDNSTAYTNYIQQFPNSSHGREVSQAMARLKLIEDLSNKIDGTWKFHASDGPVKDQLLIVHQLGKTVRFSFLQGQVHVRVTGTYKDGVMLFSTKVRGRKAAYRAQLNHAGILTGECESPRAAVGPKIFSFTLTMIESVPAAAAGNAAQGNINSVARAAPAKIVAAPAKRFAGTWQGNVDWKNIVLGGIQICTVVVSDDEKTASERFARTGIAGPFRKVTVTGNTLSWHIGWLHEQTLTMTVADDGTSASVTIITPTGTGGGTLTRQPSPAAGLPERPPSTGK